MKPVRTWKWLALVLVVVALGACGGDDEGSEEEGDEASTIQIEGEDANNHGSEDVTGMDSIEFEMDDFYFEPTVLTGEPGQAITLQAFNEGDAEHNFTLEDQGIDIDLDPGAEEEIEVTFPDSGTLLFFCEFHADQGMRGGLES